MSNHRAEMHVLSQALVYLGCIKSEDTLAKDYCSGLSRAFISAIGSFTNYGALYVRLGALEDAIKFPVKRNLP